MRDGLINADRLVELFALLDVGDCEVESLLSDTDGFESGRRKCPQPRPTREVARHLRSDEDVAAAPFTSLDPKGRVRVHRLEGLDIAPRHRRSTATHRTLGLRLP